jgi:hypothetical protein
MDEDGWDLANIYITRCEEPISRVTAAVTTRARSGRSISDMNNFQWIRIMERFKKRILHSKETHFQIYYHFLILTYLSTVLNIHGKAYGTD